MGKILCATRPVGAEVWVDGKNTGRKTNVPKSAPLELPVGKHKIQFKMGNKSSPPQEIVVEEGDPQIIRAELPE